MFLWLCFEVCCFPKNHKQYHFSLPKEINSLLATVFPVYHYMLTMCVCVSVLGTAAH